MKNTARELIQRGANDSSASSSSRDDVVATPPAFVARMTHIPFVNSAISMYEQGKASSRMVKVRFLSIHTTLSYLFLVWR